MINRLSNPINRNRSAAKISKVMSSSHDTKLPSYIKASGKVGFNKNEVNHQSDLPKQFPDLPEMGIQSKL